MKLIVYGCVLAFAVFPATILLSIDNKAVINLSIEEKGTTPKRSSPEPKIIYDNWIGIDSALADDGVQVIGVYPNSSAEKAGLQQWDYITAIHNHKVKSNRDFIFIVCNLAPGTVTQLKYKRKSIEYTTEIQISKRENLVDMVGRKAVPLDLEAYRDGKTYSLDFKADKIKIVYFLNSVHNTKDRISNQLIQLLGDGHSEPKLSIYGLTVMNCRSLKPINPSPLKQSTEFVCDEIRLSESEGKPPFDIYYDNKAVAALSYRVIRRPAIIAIDNDGIIRFADYVDETNISQIVAKLRNLLQNSKRGR